MDAYQTIAALYVGNGANRVNIGPTGNITLEGDATVFDDVYGQLTGESLFSPAGKADYDHNEACVVYQPLGDITVDGDCVVISLPIPHSAKADAPFHLHMHYEQPDASVRTFSHKYRVQKNGQAKTVTWSSAVTVNSTDALATIYPYVSGTLNQIINLGSISLTSAGLSATVQIRLTRTDATAGNINVSAIDGHVEKDSSGSNSEYTK